MKTDPALGVACYLVAAVLFLLAAVPPMPYNSSLMGVGLLFLSLGHLLS